MENVAARLKRLRTERGLKQEDIAEALHVTRQAVSNWETGRTLVSVDYLTAYAELFSVSMDELIYGKAVKEEDYPQYQRKYVVLCCLCAAMFAVYLLFELTLEPLLQDIKANEFRIMPLLIYAFSALALVGSAAGILLPSIMALRADIRLSLRARKIAACIAIVLAAAYAAFLLQIFAGIPITSEALRKLFLFCYKNFRLFGMAVPFAASMAAFLALNR